MEKINIYFLKRNGKYFLSSESKDKIRNKKGVYIFYIEDGSVYIGQSTNLLDRMMAHKSSINTQKGKNYNSLKFYKHICENNFCFYLSVLIFPNDVDRRVLQNKEKELVISFKKYSKFSVLNETEGGNTVSDKVKVDITLYETKPVTNSYFIKMCKNKNLDPSLYERIDSGLKISGGRKLFYFKSSTETNDIKVDRGYNCKNPNSKPMEYYETNPFQIYNFKQICKRRCWNFEHFKIDFAYKKHGVNYFIAKYIGEDNSHKFQGMTYKIAESKYKSVVQMDLQENMICIYKSIIDAHNQTGINYNGISRCCSGKQKTCGGFIWRYHGRKN